MEFSFTYQLSAEQEINFKQFYSSLKTVTIEQHSHWPLVEKANVKYCYFIAHRNNDYRCTAIITENLSAIAPTATVRFGPLHIDSEDLIISIKALYDYYFQKKFLALSIQLAIIT